MSDKQTPYEQAVQMFVQDPKVKLAVVSHKTGLPIKNVKFIRTIGVHLMMYSIKVSVNKKKIEWTYL